MTERELSERLDELSTRLSVSTNDASVLQMVETVLAVAEELKKLSNEKYTPGSTSWEDVKKRVPTNKIQPTVFRNSSGKALPF